MGDSDVFFDNDAVDIERCAMFLSALRCTSNNFVPNVDLDSFVYVKHSRLGKSVVPMQ